MSDIRLSCAFHQHPKTRKVFRRLGAAGPWALVCLFLWARSSRPDGDLSGLSDEDIEIAADWVGAEGQLVSTLVACGFLDGVESERRIHDWAEHQPWSAGSEDRSERAKWRALVKHHGREGATERMPEYAAKLASMKSAGAQDEATESAAAAQHATSMPVAESSMKDVAARSAPSPYPYPLPSPKAEEQEPRALASEAVADPEPARAPSPEGDTCRRLIKLGIPQVNPSHPALLDLLRDGATPEGIEQTAAELATRGRPPGFKLVLATVRGRMEDVAAGLTTGRGIRAPPTRASISTPLPQLGSYGQSDIPDDWTPAQAAS